MIGIMVTAVAAKPLLLLADYYMNYMGYYGLTLPNISVIVIISYVSFKSQHSGLRIQQTMMHEYSQK
jgi:hypothetical protein